MFNKHIFTAALLIFLFSSGKAWATHGSIGAGISHAGPITTVSAATLHKGTVAFELATEFQKFDTFSEAELVQFAQEGRSVHNVDYLFATTMGVAFGITPDLTIHVRVPYILRNDISENHEAATTGEIEFRGDAKGIGDLAVFGHYHFLHMAHEKIDLALLVGLKAPTGDTSKKDSGGELFEAEFQPGSGSWDPGLGVAFTKGFGSLSFDANVFYILVNEGTQKTDLGDVFNYNASLSYRALSMPLALDLILEANGLWRDKEKTAGMEDPNSGGNIILLSPGLRASLSHRLMAYLSFGMPLAQDLNGIQNELDYRLVGGINIGF